ncbi:MAG: Ig-like domain-containing protein [Actinomycetes bacterium]|jgi:hypothetical protein|nr:Ig-like domain-containing protein [Actinomycetes bacterium]
MKRIAHEEHIGEEQSREVSTPRPARARRYRANAWLMVGALLISTLAGPITAAFAATKDWAMFRGDARNNGVTTGHTPRSATEVVSAWSDLKVSGSSVSSPILVDGTLYVAVDDTLHEVDAATGVILRSAALDAAIGFTAYLAAGEGKIFVPIGGGRVQSFDAATLTSQWTSAEHTGFSSAAVVTYHEGRLYTGTYKSYDFNGNSTEGEFYCLNAADGKQVWTYSPSVSGETTLTGYNWAGAAVADDAEVVLFAGDDGVLVSHALDSDSVVATRSVGAPVRSSVLFDGGENHAYVTTTTGKLYRSTLTGAGSFDADDPLTAWATLSGKSSSSVPVLYRQRLYVISGLSEWNLYDEPETGWLDVIDTAEGRLISRAQLPGYSQSSPLLTTGYATSANGYEVYLYLLLNSGRGDDVVVVKDSEQLSALQVSQLYQPGGTNAMGSLLADDAGQLYFVDGGDWSDWNNPVPAKLRALKVGTPAPPAPPAAVSVKVTPAKKTLNPTKTVTLKATVTPSGASQKVSWSSSAKSVAKVNATTGKVTAVKPGKATITARTANGKVARTTITVKAGKVSKFTVKAPKTLKRGKTAQLKVTLKPATAFGAKVTYKSHYKRVLTVSKTGKIKARRRGMATITIKAGNKTKKIRIRVR